MLSNMREHVLQLARENYDLKNRDTSEPLKPSDPLLVLLNGLFRNDPSLDEIVLR